MSTQPSMVMHWNTVRIANKMLSKLVMPKLGPVKYSLHSVPLGQILAGGSCPQGQSAALSPDKNKHRKGFRWWHGIDFKWGTGGVATPNCPQVWVWDWMAVCLSVRVLIEKPVTGVLMIIHLYPSKLIENNYFKEKWFLNLNFVLQNKVWTPIRKAEMKLIFLANLWLYRKESLCFYNFILFMSTF